MKEGRPAFESMSKANRRERGIRGKGNKAKREEKGELEEKLVKRKENRKRDLKMMKRK